MNYKSAFGLLTIVIAGTLAGCSSTTKSPDVTGSIRTSLDQAGYKDVSVSQDRDKGVVTLSGHVVADTDKAQALKLKEPHGAVITLIDHDAPAGQIGLKVNDVVLQLNGQNVEGAEQLRRLLKDIPPGRKVSIEISRDGNLQTMAVELADRQVLGHDVWNKIDSGGDVFVQPPSMGILSSAAMCLRRAVAFICLSSAAA